MVVLTDAIRGGTQIRHRSIVTGLKARGWQILFVSLAPGGPVIEDLRHAGVEVASLNLSSPIEAPLVLARLRGLVKSWRPSLVQSALWHANLLSRLAVVGTGVPHASGYTSVEPTKSWHRVLTERASRGLSEVHVSVSQAVADQIASRERLPVSRTEVIHPGIEVERFAPTGAREPLRRTWGVPLDVPVVGWVGRMHRAKNLPLLLEAMGSLEGWWVALAGEGEEARKVEEMSRDLGASERLVSVGGTDDVAGFLEAIDVFCLPSLWEGMPLALMEAMAAGRPCVATAVGGVLELVTPGVDGLMVPLGDASVLAGAITEAASRPELGRRAIVTIRDRFSETKMLDGYDALWRRLVGMG
jgi:glycosyltransferase involved in cell wall biosynthesis